jgi:hypothetical protein
MKTTEKTHVTALLRLGVDGHPWPACTVCCLQNPRPRTLANLGLKLVAGDSYISAVQGEADFLIGVA